MRSIKTRIQRPRIEGRAAFGGACIDCAIVPRYALVLCVYIADRALPVCTGGQY